jgi:hypothetical protein
VTATWTCLFLGGPLDARWFTTVRYRSVRVRDTGRVVLDPASPLDVMTLPEVTTYVPHRYRVPGWRIPLDLYLHQSLGIAEPVIPAGTVLPGSIMGMTGESREGCVVCGGEPIEGWPFCERRTAGMSHAVLAAEIIRLRWEMP